MTTTWARTLEGKAIVVTGAGRGLGRAYARHAAAAGAAVLVNDVDAGPAGRVAAEITDAGGCAWADHGSVADPAHAAALIRRCVELFGGIDGLVNNAGVRYSADSWRDDPGRIRELMDVNVLGSLYCGMSAAGAMRDRGGGVIVNVVSGSMLGTARATAYSTSKGAVASMTVAWAQEFAVAGIRVNGLSPLAWTRMAAADPNAPSTPDDTPDRIAPVVTYLLSDLSAGLTGQLIRFTGDRLCVVRQPAITGPVLTRDRWEVADVAAAFAGALATVFEPPPAHRWARSPHWHAPVAAVTPPG